MEIPSLRPPRGVDRSDRNDNVETVINRSKGDVKASCMGTLTRAGAISKGPSHGGFTQKRGF